MLLGVVVAVVLVVGILIFLVKSSMTAKERPSHLRVPIQEGLFRVVAFDRIPGGDDLTDPIGDYGDFQMAISKAAEFRRKAEADKEKAGDPTKYYVFDHRGIIVADWTGPKATPDV